MAEAYLYEAVRTPRGKAGSALAQLPPQMMVQQLVAELQRRFGHVALDQAERLLLGCVGQVGPQGGHLALVCKLAAGLNERLTVKTLNNYCVSGLSAVGEATLWAQAQPQSLSLAGGVECLSQVPFLADQGHFYQQAELRQQLRWAPPVVGAELLANVEGISRDVLDAVALRSHQHAASAWANGHFDTAVVPMVDEHNDVLLQQDECIRSGLTAVALGELPTAFEEVAAPYLPMLAAACPELTTWQALHTIAHCPPMADGAALVLVGGAEAGQVVGITPKAKVLAYAEAAASPVRQFTAGFVAMEQALQQAGLSLAELDLIECMEAFAAVPAMFLRDYDVDPAKVNVNGGHIAMGHPMGATGAILLTTLLHELQRRQQRLGLVVAHAANGLGNAMIIENLS